MNNPQQDNAIENNLNEYNNYRENVTSIYKRKGWYLPNAVLKQSMFKVGGYLDCYTCNKSINYSQVRFSHTIPFKWLPFIDINGETQKMNNTYVVCNECVDESIIELAPMSYQCILQYNSRKDSLIQTKKKILLDLETTYIALAEEENAKKGVILELQSNIYKLKDKMKDLTKHQEIESKKQEKLIEYQNRNTELTKKILESKRRTKGFAEKSMRDCDKYFSKMYNNMSKYYSDFNKHIREDMNAFEALTSVEIASKIPCQICYTNNVNTTLIPCGHCLCHSCYGNIISNNNDHYNKCPFCNTVDVSPQKIYFNF